MMAFITNNLVTILAIFILALIIILALAHLFKNRKQGKTSCDFGGSCSGCPNAELCHSPLKK